MTTPITVLLAAVEPSGDALGASLYRVLKERLPDNTNFIGCGGIAMEAAGFSSAFSTDAFSVIGLTGFLKAIPEGMKRAREIGELAASNHADIGVYIDGWAFSWRAARYTKLYSPNTLTVKYATPQVWASRPKRVERVREHFDSVLTLLPFEPAWFEAAGVRAEFVGNPNFQSVYEQNMDGVNFIQQHGLQDKKILIVLPGSRKSEVSQLAPVLNETISKLVTKHPDLAVIIPPAPSVRYFVKELFAPSKDQITYIEPEERFSAFKAATAAIAASGTVTTELAIAGTPMIVAYKTDALTALWAKSVVTTDYVTILNNAAGREVIPEYLQEDCTTEMVLPAIEALLSDEVERTRQKAAFGKLLEELEIDQAPAAEKAADAVLELLRSNGRLNADGD
ncbi:MAG: lipid-A-disaccharide synthase [Aquisalinus sp.]|nr:lipid-A-disaccharide synthase [Aquisalinus sp.]